MKNYAADFNAGNLLFLFADLNRICSSIYNRHVCVAFCQGFSFSTGAPENCEYTTGEDFFFHSGDLTSNTYEIIILSPQYVWLRSIFVQ